MICIGQDATTHQFIRVEARDGIITSVEELIVPPGTDTLLAPGFIDIQVNGYLGVDYCAPGASLEDIDRSLGAQFAAGITRLFPTVITGAESTMTGAMKTLARARRELRHGHALEAFHIEGPHIHPDDGPRGAHPKSAVRPPDIEEFKRWQDASEGNVRLVTLSPHWPEAPRYIEHLVGQGVVVAIGHLSADKLQIDDAVRAGATMSTHLGNGSHGMLRRHPNYIWHQMADDRLTASFIVDGIHLDPSFLTVALRSKGLERSVLITDAVMPAGCAPGDYMLGEMPVTLHAETPAVYDPATRTMKPATCGKVTLRGVDQLAGSALRMDRGVDNLMQLCGLTLREALSLATRNPARAGRIAGRQRGLAPGDRADLIEFKYDNAAKSISIERTWLGGECVFEA